MWGPILGAAGSIGLGLLGENKQKKAFDAANAANLRQVAEAQAFLGQGKTDALAAQQKGIQFAEQGFQEAKGLAGTIGEASRSRVLRREKAYRGAADANAANRGLYASTAAVNAQRGIQEQTDVTLAGIDESIAGLMSQIAQSQGRTALQGYSAKAGIFQQFAAQQAQMATSITNVAGNVGGGYGAMAGGLMQLLGQFYGGGSGGGGESGGAGLGDATSGPGLASSLFTGPF